MRLLILQLFGGAGLPSSEESSPFIRAFGFALGLERVPDNVLMMQGRPSTRWLSHFVLLPSPFNRRGIACKLRSFVSKFSLARLMFIHQCCFVVASCGVPANVFTTCLLAINRCIQLDVKRQYFLHYIRLAFPRSLLSRF